MFSMIFGSFKLEFGIRNGECHCEERSDAAIRLFQRQEDTDCHASAAALARNDRGGRSFPRGGKWPRNEADRGLTESPYRHGSAVPPPPQGEARDG